MYGDLCPYSILHTYSAQHILCINSCSILVLLCHFVRSRGNYMNMDQNLRLLPLKYKAKSYISKNYSFTTSTANQAGTPWSHSHLQAAQYNKRRTCWPLKFEVWRSLWDFCLQPVLVFPLFLPCAPPFVSPCVHVCVVGTALLCSQLPDCWSANTPATHLPCNLSALVLQPFIGRLFS